jgi:hypothetical protein
MHAGSTYRDLTQEDLMELVRQLQPQVEQLADVLSLELSGDRDYMRTLIEAHERLGLLAEQFVSAVSAPADDVAHATLLQQSRELTDAMHSFLQYRQEGEHNSDSVIDWDREHAAHSPHDVGLPAETTQEVKPSTQLLRKLQLAGSRCRAQRQELSLLLVAPGIDDPHAGNCDESFSRQVGMAIDRACAALHQERVTLALTPQSVAVILPDCERRVAVSIAKHAIAELAPADAATKQRMAPHPLILSAGIATASSVPKNFDTAHLVASAERCLHAARACGISSVKSIEV